MLRSIKQRTLPIDLLAHVECQSLKPKGRGKPIAVNHFRLLPILHGHATEGVNCAKAFHFHHRKAELPMRMASMSLKGLSLCFALSVVSFLPLGARAQSCQTSADLDDAARNSITSAAVRYFDMAARGDSA